MTWSALAISVVIRSGLDCTARSTTRTTTQFATCTLLQVQSGPTRCLLMSVSDASCLCQALQGEQHGSSCEALSTTGVSRCKGWGTTTGKRKKIYSWGVPPVAKRKMSLLQRLAHLNMKENEKGQGAQHVTYCKESSTTRALLQWSAHVSRKKMARAEHNCAAVAKRWSQ